MASIPCPVLTHKEECAFELKSELQKAMSNVANPSLPLGKKNILFGLSEMCTGKKDPGLLPFSGHPPTNPAPTSMMICFNCWATTYLSKTRSLKNLVLSLTNESLVTNNTNKQKIYISSTRFVCSSIDSISINDFQLFSKASIRMNHLLLVTAHLKLHSPQSKGSELFLQWLPISKRM